MSWWRRLRTMFQPARWEDDLEAELTFHIDKRIDEKIAAGVSAAEARATVLRRFGNRTRVQEDTRAQDRIAWLDVAAQDVRYGLRVLGKSPGFTAVAALSLALGIGANSAMFSVASAFASPTLPYRDAHRIIQIRSLHAKDREPHLVSIPDFVDITRSARNLSSTAALLDVSFVTNNGELAERLIGARVSPGFFNFLGVRPMLGREFTAGENAPGKDRVAIIGYGYWERRFHRSETALGQVLKLDGDAYTVVGVLPPWFHWLHWRNTDCGDPAGETAHCLDVFAPLNYTMTPGERGNRSLFAMARLAPAARFDDARGEMQALASRIARQNPATAEGWTLRLDLLHKSLNPSGWAVGWVVMQVAVGFVLLIACSNVANLLLARATARQRELAIRGALGASRARIVRQLLTEGLLLGSMGGVLGLFAAVWGARLISRTVQLDMLDGVLDNRVLVFTAIITITAALLFSLFPALASSKPNAGESLSPRARASGATARLRGARSGLVIAQMSLAVVLLIGAGLSIRTFANSLRVNLGFDPRNLIVARIPIAPQKYRDPVARTEFLRTILNQMAALPGATSVALVTWPQLWGAARTHISREGDMALGDARPTVSYRGVSQSYFRTLRVRMIAGRDFSSADRGRPVVIVTETLARALWPAGDALGQHVTLDTPVAREIIGIAPQLASGPVTDLTRPQIFELTEAPAGSPWLIVRTAAGTGPLIAAMQREIANIDRDQPLTAIQTYAEVIADRLNESYAGMTFLASFAGMALILAGIGVYGVMAYMLTQRRPEIGIRVALGAKPADVLRLLCSQGARLALLGTGIGLTLAFALTRVMAQALYGVSPTDAPTFAASAAVLFAIAMLACWLPARRALRIDPMDALRHE